MSHCFHEKKHKQQSIKAKYNLNKMGKVKSGSKTQKNYIETQ